MGPMFGARALFVGGNGPGGGVCQYRGGGRRMWKIEGGVDHERA